MEIPSLPGVSSSRSRELRGQPALDAIARDTLDGLSASTLSDVLQLAQVTRTREPELAAAACRLLECWRKTGALTVPAGTGPTEWMSTAAWCQGTEILLTPAEADLAALRATADLGVRSPSSTDQEDGARARAQLLRLQPEMATPEVLKGQLQPILKSSNQSSEAQALTVSTVAAHYGWDRALQSVLGAARSNVSVPFMPLVDALDSGQWMPSPKSLAGLEEFTLKVLERPPISNGFFHLVRAVHQKVPFQRAFCDSVVEAALEGKPVSPLLAGLVAHRAGELVDSPHLPALRLALRAPLSEADRVRLGQALQAQGDRGRFDYEDYRIDALSRHCAGLPQAEALREIEAAGFNSDFSSTKVMLQAWLPLVQPDERAYFEHNAEPSLHSPLPQALAEAGRENRAAEAIREMDLALRSVDDLLMGMPMRSHATDLYRLGRELGSVEQTCRLHRKIWSRLGCNQAEESRKLALSTTRLLSDQPETEVTRHLELVSEAVRHPSGQALLEHIGPVFLREGALELVGKLAARGVTAKTASKLPDSPDPIGSAGRLLRLSEVIPDGAGAGQLHAQLEETLAIRPDEGIQVQELLFRILAQRSHQDATRLLEELRDRADVSVSSVSRDWFGGSGVSWSPGRVNVGGVSVRCRSSSQASP